MSAPTLTPRAAARAAVQHLVDALTARVERALGLHRQAVARRAGYVARHGEDGTRLAALDAEVERTAARYVEARECLRVAEDAR